MTWIIPFLCGLLTGTVSAWGVGGGTLLLLVMTLFLGVDHRTAQGINLMFFLPTAAAALLFHGKNGYIDQTTWKRATPWGMVFALGGAWIAATVDVALLRKPFGIFLLFAGASILWQSFRKKKQPPASDGK